MKFITEEVLRELFRKEPFTSYEIKADQRLTPGGRQFLLDRGVKVWEQDFSIKQDTKKVNAKEADCSIGKKIITSKLKSMEALFLDNAQKLLNIDICLAQSIIKLGKCFSDVSSFQASSYEKNCLKECNGINIQNFSNDLDDCFEITEFHIQLEKGREIIILHRLRCSLRELGLFILEYQTNSSENEYQDITKMVNQSINTLSQMVCSMVGGKKCQKEN